MKGESRLTLSGLEKLAQASIDKNVKVVPKTVKVSSANIELEPTLENLPSVWISLPIAGARKVSKDAIEFIVDVPPDKATDYFSVCGLFLEDGTLFAVAKPPHRIPPGVRQRLVIRILYSNISELLDLKYVPLDDFELQLIDFANYLSQTEANRQLLSSGIISVGYGNENPQDDVVNSSMHSVAFSALGIHNHSNYRAMPGMGWWTANVNGFIFQTRHNDYRMFKKANDGGLIEDTPPKSPNLSVNQMRDLFRRYVSGNLYPDEKSLFRWSLAYAEVFILEVDSPFDPIDDTFSSFRHSWGIKPVIELFKETVLQRITGKKARFENNTLLPIFSLPNGKYGVLVYRILTEPLPQLDGKRWNEVVEEYDLYEVQNVPFTHPKKRFRVKYPIDELIESVPGLDGKNAYIEQIETTDGHKITGKNYAYYHRIYKLADDDAVNLREYSLGWNDRTLFVAHTQNSKVWGGVSYLIPLELILRTPLETWNPLNIPHRVKVRGKGTQAEPFDGWNENGRYFLTPVEFFGGMSPPSTPADTSYKAYVKDANGNIHLNVASGIWITLPSIPGVGQIRIRFPIYFDAIEEGLIGYFIQVAKRQVDLSVLDISTSLGTEIFRLGKEIELLKSAREALLENDKKFGKALEEMKRNTEILWDNQKALMAGYVQLSNLVLSVLKQIQKLKGGN